LVCFYQKSGEREKRVKIGRRKAENFACVFLPEKDKKSTARAKRTPKNTQRKNNRRESEKLLFKRCTF